MQAAHWPEVLEFCNEALAIATPTHEAKRFKIFARHAGRGPAHPEADSGLAERAPRRRGLTSRLGVPQRRLYRTKGSGPLSTQQCGPSRRRAAAYQGLGRLQEALRDYEAADAAAEAAGEWQPKKMIAK